MKNNGDIILIIATIVLAAYVSLFTGGCVRHKYPADMSLQKIQVLEQQREIKDELVRFMKCCCNTGDNACCHEMELLAAELKTAMEN